MLCLDEVSGLLLHAESNDLQIRKVFGLRKLVDVQVIVVAANVQSQLEF